MARAPQHPARRRRRKERGNPLDVARLGGQGWAVSHPCARRDTSPDPRGNGNSGAGSGWGCREQQLQVLSSTHHRSLGLNSDFLGLLRELLPALELLGSVLGRGSGKSIPMGSLCRLGPRFGKNPLFLGSFVIFFFQGPFLAAGATTGVRLRVWLGSSRLQESPKNANEGIFLLIFLLIQLQHSRMLSPAPALKAESGIPALEPLG